MRMRVDAAREDVLAARVNDAIRSYVQGFADQGDPLAFDVDVADVVVRRGYDAAAFDQNRHRGSPLSVVAFCVTCRLQSSGCSACATCGRTRRRPPP